MIFQVNVEFIQETLEISGNQITIGIKSKPIKGEANKEIIKKLAKHFGVSSKKILIKSGHKSKNKIIEIQDVKIVFGMNKVYGWVTISKAMFFDR